ncbi:PQQ-dependent catabolism-associated beta-propeller protein [Billgrantia aerodenitrificans]|uniref:PQQ-dependent catabolism-associated beta-propeller protein n=1 Tax=Billgrantia aerodenitrificans TaxID=2733483 RepID=A0ABS9AWB2_9GAMM|nr:PQQ-dependent catabolism-associated beta-propeller protein [Halomonas aerodenitrificans]MCE8026188.1 PQQ-dependent catabolism-associated beta-propeller protein [Halomonas aerodenitrificans]
MPLLNRMISPSLLGLVLGALALLPVSAQAERIFVSNEKDNTISVIDGASLEVVETISVGRRPRSMAFSSDGSELFVAVGDDEAIDMIDLETLQVVRSQASGDDPEVIRVDPNRPYIYVSNEDDNIVSVLDYERRTLVTEIPVGVEPEGLGISPDGRWLVSTTETSNMAHIIDTETMEAVYHRLVGARPRHAEFTHDGREAWVSAEIAGTVSILDMEETFDVKHVIRFDVPGVPRETVQAVGVALTSDGRYGFVALGPSNRVAVVDQQTYEVLDYILVGQRVWHLALNGDESRLYTTNGVSGDVTMIEVDSLRAVKSIPVGRFPWGVIVEP